MSDPHLTNPAFWTLRRGPLPELLPGQQPDDEDHARIIHSYAFRRLQGKTQVLGIGEAFSDVYRTRLTHSLEVAELGRALLAGLEVRSEGQPWAALVPGRTLMANICLAHDLGHPPFGHAGERALDAAMRASGPVGFEANGQTLRLLTHLESGPEPAHGLNLTRRALLGVLKYPVAYSLAALVSDHRPPKCYLDTEAGVVDWLLAPLSEADRARFTAPGGGHRSFDSRLMELADDAAYAVYDFEDSVNLELVTRGDWNELAAGTPELEMVPELNAWAGLVFNADESARKRGVVALSGALVGGVEVTRQAVFAEPLLDLRADFTPAAAALQRFLTALVWQRVIDTPQVREPERLASAQLRALFGAAQAEPLRWLGAQSRRRYAEASKRAEAGDQAGRDRVICDYLAGMTDSYALKQSRRLAEGDRV
ncbi:dGTP triphosphohydrolase [Deinococcus sp.]|uniref:dGTP triphosphohydrolase n=1 Tax=Deinococcus sp. TaxID=47478 RepID=UPI0026007B1C|nr:dNTP triphosphohydrolase [Deinococcus sp.]